MGTAKDDMKIEGENRIAESSSEVDSDSSSEDTEDSSDSSSDCSSIEETAECVSFPSSYSLLNETAVSMEKSFLCHMCGSSSQKLIGTALSDFSVVVYDLSNLKKVSKFEKHESAVSNIRFHPCEQSLLLSSSLDGKIRVWDTRIGGQSVMEFKDDTLETGKLKPIVSFDVAHSGNFVCGGTELAGGDAYLDFWDARTTKLLGGYWESHSDDITQVKYHPSLSDVVMTGSTDGLINIFDLSKNNEDDALLYSLNTQSSVDKVTWLLLDGAVKAVSCTTHTMDVQIWEQDGASPLMSFSRKQISKAVKGLSSGNCYTVDVHQKMTTGEVILLTGSEEGKGESLHLMTVTDKCLTPRSALPGNKQIVRCSWYNPESGQLITGGESGIISVWQPVTEGGMTSATKQLKVSKQTSHRTKPY